MPENVRYDRHPPVLIFWIKWKLEKYGCRTHCWQATQSLKCLYSLEIQSFVLAVVELFGHSTCDVTAYHSEWHGSHSSFSKTLCNFKKSLFSAMTLYFPFWNNKALFLTSKSIYLLFSRSELTSKLLCWLGDGNLTLLRLLQNCWAQVIYLLPCHPSWHLRLPHPKGVDFVYSPMFPFSCKKMEDKARPLLKEQKLHKAGGLLARKLL